MVMFSGIKCSTAHMSKQDYEIFANNAHRDRPWIHDTCYGYLLIFREYRHPGLMLKDLGVTARNRNPSGSQSAQFSAQIK